MAILRLGLGLFLLAASIGLGAVFVRDVMNSQGGSDAGAVIWGVFCLAFAVVLVRRPSTASLEVEADALVIRSPGEMSGAWRIPRDEVVAIVLDSGADDSKKRFLVAGEALWDGRCRGGFPLVGDPVSPPDVAFVFRSPMRVPRRIAYDRRSSSARRAGGVLLAACNLEVVSRAVSAWHPTADTDLDHLPGYEAHRKPLQDPAELPRLEGPLVLIDARNTSTGRGR